MFGHFLVLFGMIAVGYYGSQKKWLTREVSTGISALVMKITCPLLLFALIGRNEIGSDILQLFFGIAVGHCLAMMICGKFIRILCRRWEKDDMLLGMLECTTGSVNNGFIGLPIALIFFGDQGALYMSACVLGLHLYLWFYGVRVVQGKGAKTGSFLASVKKVLNPNCVMIFVGLFFSLTRLTAALPDFLMEFIVKMGDLSTPLSLIYIGAMAGNEGIVKLLAKKQEVIISLLKLFILPAFTGTVLFFLPVEPLVKMVVFASMAMPSAAIVPMVVEQYGGKGAETASDIVLLTTFFSMATMPFCIWLCQLVF